MARVLGFLTAVVLMYRYMRDGVNGGIIPAECEHLPWIRLPVHTVRRWSGPRTTDSEEGGQSYAATQAQMQ